MSELKYVSGNQVKLIRRTDSLFLDCQIGDELHSNVHLIRAFPLSKPHEMISIRDAENKEFGIIESIAESFDILGHQVVIGTSIGIALAPIDLAETIPHGGRRKRIAGMVVLHPLPVADETGNRARRFRFGRRRPLQCSPRPAGRLPFQRQRACAIWSRPA